MVVRRASERQGISPSKMPSLTLSFPSAATSSNCTNAMPLSSSPESSLKPLSKWHVTFSASVPQVWNSTQFCRNDDCVDLNRDGPPVSTSVCNQSAPQSIRHAVQAEWLPDAGREGHV